MRAVVSVVLLLFFTSSVTGGWFQSEAPKSALEAVEKAFFGKVKILEKNDSIEMTLKENGGLSALSYHDVVEAVLAYSKFSKKSGANVKSITAWHYSNVTDKYGNESEMRTGSLKWSADDLSRFNYEKGDWHMMLNLATINDVLVAGRVSLLALCDKSYASLYAVFCMNLSLKLRMR